jgi:flagellar basal-body rod modification protein FlgD
MASITNIKASAADLPEVQKKSAKNELSPDDFIKLFLAQMKNQNPAHPTDSSAILQQMSEISSMSASHDMQKTLSTLTDNVNIALANSQVLQSTQMIGKKVQVLSETSPLIAGEGLSGSAVIPSAVSDVKVMIKDSAGTVVKTLDLGAASSGGLVDFKWDGVGDDGKKFDPGYYSISAKATIDGKIASVQTAGSFKVGSVGLNQKTGGVVLNVDGLGGTDMGDIIKIL